MIKRRRYNYTYAPGSDATLELWLDPTDSSKLTKLGGGAIANGNSVGTWATSGGAVSRTFIQWQSFPTPTYVTGAINGLAALRFQSEMLISRDSIARWNAIGGMTLMRAIKTVGTAGAVMHWSTNDAGGGDANDTHFGARGEQVYGSGWRRVHVDSFQSFAGPAAVADTVSIFTVVWDWANAKMSLFKDGCQVGVTGAAFGTAGVTDSTIYAMCFGGFTQQTGLTQFGVTTDGYTGECLLWLSAMTPQQLIAPHAYLRRRWGGGKL